MFIPVLVIPRPSHTDDDNKHNGNQCHDEKHEDDDRQVEKEARVVDGIGVDVLERIRRDVAAWSPWFQVVFLAVILIGCLPVVVGWTLRAAGLVVDGQ